VVEKCIQDWMVGPEGKRPLERPRPKMGVLKWILNKYGGRVCLDYAGSRSG
jgi:hypothetical protein